MRSNDRILLVLNAFNRSQCDCGLGVWATRWVFLIRSIWTRLILSRWTQFPVTNPVLVRHTGVYIYPSNNRRITDECKAFQISFDPGYPIQDTVRIGGTVSRDPPILLAQFLCNKLARKGSLLFSKRQLLT